MMLTVVLILTLGIALALENVINIPGSLPVRLADGESCSGRVEVYRGPQWGALCVQEWGQREANVVCRELGCGWATVGMPPLNALFGWEGPVVWLASIQCSGEEEELGQCSVRGLLRASRDARCPPHDTVAVRCSDDLHTPQIWYNASVPAGPSRVVRGHSFNVTCAVPHLYLGSSIQLRLVRSNGTERQTVSALAPSVTFSFPSAQASHEGYYYCLHRFQLGPRVFTSRESQPLPIILTEPKPLLSAMEVSWLASAVIFAVAVLGIVAVACGLRRRRRSLTELERGRRACVENTYVALPVK
ncbi:deleted in malignant brain tumors 1 protein [Conger conger]|uniref:deleted in malignant brain tumors 1 protein n=1 Tax=Conger conger TaxID=82655 RepID=UPI002A5A09EC|nr:deleted in malignant brain tumors 1 protein [Conger conger]